MTDSLQKHIHVHFLFSCSSKFQAACHHLPYMYIPVLVKPRALQGNLISHGASHLRIFGCIETLRIDCHNYEGAAGLSTVVDF